MIYGIGTDLVDLERIKKIKSLSSFAKKILGNQELKKYQSSFFKKIKESLGDREDIKITGDRFIFPSEMCPAEPC